MTRDDGRRHWPATLAEFQALEAKALAKYRPLVERLQPWEITALTRALDGMAEQLRQDANAEDDGRRQRRAELELER